LENGAVTDSNTLVTASILDEADVKALAAGNTHILLLKCYDAVGARGSKLYGNGVIAPIQ
jgi:hypothetical protein